VWAASSSWIRAVSSTPEPTKLPEPKTCVARGGTTKIKVVWMTCVVVQVGDFKLGKLVRGR
jgi:hypothetical protein